MSRPFSVFANSNPSVRVARVYADSESEALALAKTKRVAGPAPIIQDEEAEARRQWELECRLWEAVSRN